MQSSWAHIFLKLTANILLFTDLSLFSKPVVISVFHFMCPLTPQPPLLSPPLSLCSDFCFNQLIFCCLLTTHARLRPLNLRSTTSSTSSSLPYKTKSYVSIPQLIILTFWSSGVIWDFNISRWPCVHSHERVVKYSSISIYLCSFAYIRTILIPQFKYSLA